MTLRLRILKSDVRAVYLLTVSVPLTCTIPSVSHDYKLIILSTPILIMFSILRFTLSIFPNFGIIPRWQYCLGSPILLEERFSYILNHYN